jgi:caffeoyl-CoA O-methyltransferase
MDYCLEMSSPQEDFMTELERDTHLKTLAPQMLAGHILGLILEMITSMIRPGRILEIGTFTGYATICLARGLKHEGKLLTIESNPEYAHISKKYWKQAGLEDKIKLITGNAREIVPGLPGPFDLVYIDGAKSDYLFFFEVLLDKVRTGGFLLADNVLWDGKVINKKKDRDTRMIHEFNQAVRTEPRVKNLILPVRDGLSLIEKVSE